MEPLIYGRGRRTQEAAAGTAKAGTAKAGTAAATKRKGKHGTAFRAS